MNSLYLAAGLFAKAEEGDKLVTIRKDHRPIAPGPMMLVEVDEQGKPTGRDLRVDVWRVTHTNLACVPQSVLEADGFEDPADLLRGMQVFYPDINFASPVTILEWYLP